MFRTVMLPLEPTAEQRQGLFDLQASYAQACNTIAKAAQRERCWNRNKLHHHVYYPVRDTSPLGAQMVCNAIFSVCKAYKSLAEQNRILPNKPVPQIQFKKRSIHFDKRTYTLNKDQTVALYTLQGRITVPFRMGEHQEKWLSAGVPKEAELVTKKGKWYFHLVLELEAPPERTEGRAMGVDIGENMLAATSTGLMLGGERLRDKRDRHLAFRRRLQRNGSRNAKRKLRKISGRERRHVKQVNHHVSKEIIKEAKLWGMRAIGLEDLRNLRQRIRAKKRERTRLHRWAFRELRMFITYKAQAEGMGVVLLNPAYTSQTCSRCGEKGSRKKHRFTCSKCGFRAHADGNASRNLARMAESADSARAVVNRPIVAGDGETPTPATKPATSVAG